MLLDTLKQKSCQSSVNGLRCSILCESGNCVLLSETAWHDPVQVPRVGVSSPASILASLVSYGYLDAAAHAEVLRGVRALALAAAQSTRMSFAGFLSQACGELMHYNFCCEITKYCPHRVTCGAPCKLCMQGHLPQPCIFT